MSDEEDSEKIKILNKKIDKKWMKKVFKHLGICFVIFLLLVLGFVYLSNLETSEVVNQDNNLAQKLNDSGWVMYYLPSCGHCTEQKQVFGDNVEDLSMVNPRTDMDNIPNWLYNKQIPVWRNEEIDKTIEGMKNREELKEMINSTN